MTLLLARVGWPDPAPEYVKAIEEDVAAYASFYKLCLHEDCTPCLEQRQRHQLAVEMQSKWLPDQNRYVCHNGSKHRRHLLRDGSMCPGRSFDMT